MIKEKIKLENIIFIFLISALLVQIFFLKNINFQDRSFEPEFCYSSENSILNKDDINNEERLIIETLDIPLFPELQNFKCLNKIYKVDKTQDNTTIYFAQNEIIFNYAYYLLVLLNFLIYLRYKSKNILYTSFFLILNLYVLLNAIFTYEEIVYFALLIFLIPLLTNDNVKSLLDSKYIFPLILFLGFVLQIKYLSKEVVDWDISTFLIMGQDINRGYLPYENQFELKPVLLFYIYSFVDLISQGDLKIVKILNDIPLLISTYLMYETLREKTNRVYANAGTLFFLVLMSVSYFGVPGYSELYALVPLAYFFYQLETKSDKNFYVLGALLALSTLINLGTSPIFFGISIYLFRSYRKEIIKFFVGFAFPHLLFLFIYGVNDLLTIYIEANLLIPANYQNNSIFEKLLISISGFYGAIFGLININIILFFVSISTLIFILFYRIFKNKKSQFNSLPFIFISCILHLLVAGTAPHRFIFIIYFLVFYIHLINFESFIKLFVPAYVLIYLVIFNTFVPSIYSNIKNYESIDSTYVLMDAAKNLKNYEYNSILALDHHLILYYLDIENDSYVVHPSLIWLEHINKFSYKENDEKTFKNLLTNDPDIILCNSYLYNFCKKIDGYELIYLKDYYGIEIYKKILN